MPRCTGLNKSGVRCSMTGGNVKYAWVHGKSSRMERCIHHYESPLHFDGDLAVQCTSPTASHRPYAEPPPSSPEAPPRRSQIPIAKPSRSKTSARNSRVSFVSVSESDSESSVDEHKIVSALRKMNTRKEEKVLGQEYVADRQTLTKATRRRTNKLVKWDEEHLNGEGLLMKELVKAAKDATDRADMHEFGAHLLTENVVDLGEKIKKLEGKTTVEHHELEDLKDSMSRMLEDLKQLKLDVHGSSRRRTHANPFDEV